MGGVPLLSISVDSHEDELQICKQRRKYVFNLGSNQEESFWAYIKHTHTHTQQALEGLSKADAPSF